MTDPAKDEVKNNVRYDIIDKALTMLIAIVALSLFTPTLAYMASGDVALVAILSEKETEPQLWNILLILVGAITTKQVQKSPN